MALARAPRPRSLGFEQPYSFEGLSDPSGFVTMGAVHPAGDEAVWEFPGVPPTDRIARIDNAPGEFTGTLYATDSGMMTMAAVDSAMDFSGSRQRGQIVRAVWPTPPPEERRLQNAIELERAEIGFDEVAAGILGRIYDYGHVSQSELAGSLHSPTQWFAFSRLQRCRYVEDLGSSFTLSRDGREFVEEMLAEESAE